MAENPFLQLYPGDYFAKTRHFNNCQHGAYLLMIMTAWVRKDGALPNDDEFLAKITCLTIRKWKVVKPSVMEFWYVEDGYLFNERVVEDRKKIAVKTKSLSESGKKGAEAKKAKSLKSKVTASSHPLISNKPPLSILEPEPYRKESTASDNAVLLTKRKRKLVGTALERFNKFWDIFNLKQGKRDAADAWLDIGAMDEVLFDLIIAGAKREAAARPARVASGGSPKWAQGWIRGARWEDEAPKSAAARRSEWTAAEWLKTYPPDKPFAADYVRRNFCAGDIPEEIRGEYGL